MWTKLSVGTASGNYRVPIELAKKEENSFYGTQRHPESNPHDMDGPWPFLAFLRSEQRPNVFTFHIHTLTIEMIEYEGFDPVTDFGSGLRLKKQALVDLIDLLATHEQQLEPENISSEKMFRRLDSEEAVEYRLHPEWFPETIRFYYKQIYNPLTYPDDDSLITIIKLATSQSLPSPYLHFSIHQFPPQKLQDPSFEPLDFSYARINLDKKGFQELRDLLKEQLANLADS